ncbi:MAG: class I SAM-dependent methyltransferase [Desulfobacter postgatei]|uniref:class I SAM-dependent methyltransferase n=1 Tax=Desulfobacter postgatei TaxID=2293 RepID=UPI0023F43DE2|nr:class I SAM-dependent methyltransferase [Desulfobacter postgatei]MDD4273479.1 class I SAM-dependent methyltransferase [Desulfobacter postgatei]
MKQKTIDFLRKNLPLSIKHKIPRFIIDTIAGTAAGPSAKQAVADVHPENAKVITTLEELDIELKKLDRAAQVSDDALRKQFQTFSMAFHLDNPQDPWSKAYRDKQFELYRHISGKPYDIANEVSIFNVEEASNLPFPYYTESCLTVCNHLISIGFMIKMIDLKSNSNILEFGPGWGNTTEILGRMGHKVTAVDIEQNFIDLIKLRAEKNGLNIRTVHDDFAYIETIDKPVDAVLFFECFHHCSDHLKLIRSFDKAVAEDGIVVFAAEPITDTFPIPWGLRMDGESLWAIRKNGWLELGFTETYFTETMERYGWNLSKHVCNETPWGTIFIARKNKTMY